jgi:hypothetical protein
MTWFSKSSAIVTINPRAMVPRSLCGDAELEAYLSQDCIDPGFDIYTVSELAHIALPDLMQLACNRVEEFRGEIYLPYSAICELAETVEPLRVMVPAQ